MFGQTTWYTEHMDATVEVDLEISCNGNISEQMFTIGYTEAISDSRQARPYTGRELLASSEAISVEIL